MSTSRKLFTKFSSALIIYTILVILWGAFVRISHSGDGCGEHWPLCQGTIIPRGEVAALMQTWVEFFHRVKSGLLGILITIQTLWAYRIFHKGHIARTAALWVLILTFTEALLGAGLVLGGYVDNDASLTRLVVMSAHLINTLLLLGALTTLWQLSKLKTPVRRVLSRDSKIWLICIAGSIALLASTGVWAALASTLFPAETLSSGIHSDFAPDSHIFVRIRIIHPIAALILGAFISISVAKIRHLSPKESTIFIKSLLSAICLGALTLFLLSPTLLKISHLLLVDVMWVAFVTLVMRINYEDQSSDLLI